MNTLVKKYIITQTNGDKSAKFDTELAAYAYMREQPIGENYMMVTALYSADPSTLSYRATLVLTVYAHPQKTLRAIECALNQNVSGLEIIIYGDNCPNLQGMINDGYFTNKQLEQQAKGNDLIVLNNPTNYGGFGFYQRNEARKIARGVWTMYYDNDDIILPNHVETRLTAIESGDFDLVGFETFIDPPPHFYRDTQFIYGKVGHAEIAIRTEFLRNLPLLDSTYGHDWVLIDNALKAGARHYIKRGAPYTYIIKSLPNFREAGID